MTDKKEKNLRECVELVRSDEFVHYIHSEIVSIEKRLLKNEVSADDYKYSVIIAFRFYEDMISLANLAEPYLIYIEMIEWSDNPDDLMDRMEALLFGEHGIIDAGEEQEREVGAKAACDLVKKVNATIDVVGDMKKQLTNKKQKTMSKHKDKITPQVLMDTVKQVTEATGTTDSKVLAVLSLIYEKPNVSKKEITLSKAANDEKSALRHEALAIDDIMKVIEEAGLITETQSLATRYAPTEKLIKLFHPIFGAFN